MSINITSPRGRSTMRKTMTPTTIFGESLNQINLSKIEENTGTNRSESPLMDRIIYGYYQFKRNFWKSFIGKMYRGIIFVSSILSCLTYIAQTYTRYRPYLPQYDVLNVLEILLATVFSVDWSFNLLFADYRLEYITSYLSVIDFCIIVSSYTTYYRIPFDISEIHSQRQARVFVFYLMNTARILRILKVRDVLYSIKDDVQRCLAKIGLIMGTIILFWSAVMEYLELLQGYDFHTWTYFSVVTVSTVGYGDISPQSLLGRIACQTMILSAIVIVPQLTQELLDKMARATIYARAVYQPKFRTSEHILICGDLSSTVLDDIFHELFHDDHDIYDAVDIDAVVLQPKPPDALTLELMRKKSSHATLTYLQGSALNDYDLKRAKAETAIAIFLMTNKYSSDYDEEDSEIIMQQFNIKRYISQNNPLFMIQPPLFCSQLIRPENRRHLLGDIDDFHSNSYQDVIICLNELKMGIMAKSTLYPGACNLLLNMLSSFGGNDSNYSKKFNHKKCKPNEDGKGASNEDNDDDQEQNDCDEEEDPRDFWVVEYEAGCNYEVYVTDLSEMFQSAIFVELSYFLYDKFGIVLFALRITDLKSKNNDPLIVLNPKNYSIPSKEDYYVQGFVLAKDKQSSDLSFQSNEELYRGQNNSSKNVFSIAVQTAFQTSGSPSQSHQTSGKFGLIYSSSSDTLTPTKRFSKANLFASNRHEHNHSIAGPTSRLNKETHTRKENETEQEHFQRLEDSHFQQNYHLRSQLISFHDIIIQTSITLEMPHIQNHIIIMGKGIANIYDLIRPLRARHLGKLRQIVILHPYDIPPNIWQKISIFDGISFVRGSHLDENDIRRAGIFRAQEVVVLADVHHQQLQPNDIHSDIESLLDSDAIFSYQCVKRLNPEAHVIIEMIKQSNIGFLDIHNPISNSKQRDDFRFSSRFAAGSVLTTSSLDTLVCQAFHNPLIIDILHKLIQGREEIDRRELLARISTFLHEDPFKSDSVDDLDSVIQQRMSSDKYKDAIPDILKIKRSSLYQMHIPSHFKTYGELFKHLASRHIIPLGILRGVMSHLKIGPRGNKTPYVVTNPSKDTELFSCDKVFVLSPEPIQAVRQSQRESASMAPKLSTLPSMAYSEDSSSSPAHKQIKELESKVELLQANLNILYTEIMKALGKNDSSVLPLIKSDSFIVNASLNRGNSFSFTRQTSKQEKDIQAMNIINEKLDENEEDENDDDDETELSNPNKLKLPAVLPPRSKSNADNGRYNLQDEFNDVSADRSLNPSSVFSPGDITINGASSHHSGPGISPSHVNDGVIDANDGITTRRRSSSKFRFLSNGSDYRDDLMTIHNENQNIIDAVRTKPSSNQPSNSSSPLSPMSPSSGRKHISGIVATNPLSIPRRRSSSRVFSEINEAVELAAVSSPTTDTSKRTNLSTQQNEDISSKGVDDWELQDGYTIDETIQQLQQLPGQDQLTSNLSKNTSPLMTEFDSNGHIAGPTLRRSSTDGDAKIKEVNELLGPQRSVSEHNNRRRSLTRDETENIKEIAGIVPARRSLGQDAKDSNTPKSSIRTEDSKRRIARDSVKFNDEPKIIQSTLTAIPASPLIDEVEYDNMSDMDEKAYEDDVDSISRESFRSSRNLSITSTWTDEGYDRSNPSQRAERRKMLGAVLAANKERSKTVKEGGSSSAQSSEPTTPHRPKSARY